MPGKQSIWCHKSLNFIEYFAAKDFGFCGQSPPLFISELKPLSLKLILKHTVLFDEIGDDRLLMAVKPAG